MARNTPPSLISYTETASWVTAAASKSTASISWQAGDVLAFVGATEGPNTIGVPTATGLTFTSAVLNTTASTCGTRAAFATAASTSSSAVSASNTSATNFWGFGVWVWRGSDGSGTNGEQHTTTHTKAIVPTDTHSAWMVGCFDFSAAVITGNSITPTVSNSRQKQQSSTHYSIYVGDIVDQASAASTAYGLSAGGTVGTISLAVIEVLGTTTGGATTVKNLAALGAG